MPTSRDLMQAAADGNAVEFADLYSELMQEKITDAIDARRVEVAEGLYGSSEDVIEEEVSDETGDDEDQLDLDLDEEAEEISEEQYLNIFENMTEEEYEALEEEDKEFLMKYFSENNEQHELASKQLGQYLEKKDG